MLPTPESDKFEHSSSPDMATLEPPSPRVSIFSRSPSPDLGLANVSRRIRGAFSNLGGSSENALVINGATPEPFNLFSAASNAYSTVTSQIPRVTDNVGLFASLAGTKLLHGGVVDDKRNELEAVIQFAASFPPKSQMSRDLGGRLIKPLWNDLPHPPLSYLGDDFKYRKSDGSNNNIMYPHLGAAGSSYARTVAPQTLAPAVRPDAGLLFDTLFARDRPVEHPAQISSVLFYLASIITHDIFRTDERDHNKLKNSSYLDLSPLYGSSDDPESDACVAKVRTFEDGMLKADTFSETRVYGLPPGVAALLICFNRFHNYVAVQLKEINEGGRFSPQHSMPEAKAMKKVDEDLFQTARLITCGLYLNIILHDYVRTILNLQTTDNSWTLDPRTDCENVFDRHGVPVGIGNQVSVEFNLVYRWHSTISERDAQWVENLYADIFEDDDIYKYLGDPVKFYTKVGPWMARLRSQNPEDREIRGLKRTPSGKYSDEELVDVLKESTEDVAGAFGPKNVPSVMRLIEILGIQQSRKWNVCTLNEFRKFFNLEPHRTFDDISSNKTVARTLEALYSRPDYVELYPGLVAEDAKHPIEPGSGLCPGYTTSRTILADAVALTRGDRFYTVDHTPASLTNWGFELIKSDPEVANGHVIHTLLMRAMPSYYRGNSVYAMFPFTHPRRMQEIMTKLDTAHLYDFSPPAPKHHPIPVRSFDAVERVLKNHEDYKVPWGPHTEQLTGKDFMLSGDRPENRRQHAEIKRALYCPHGAHDWAQQIYDYYHHTTSQLIKCNQDQLMPGVYQLDVVKDVANPSHTLFTSQLFHIPIQDSDDGSSARDMYYGFALLFAYVFLDGDTAKSFKLRAMATKATKKLSMAMRLVVQAVRARSRLPLPNMFSRSKSGELLSSYGRHMIERMLSTEKDVDDVVGEILPTAAGAVATQAQAMTQMIDVYLKEEHRHHWADIRKSAYSDKEADRKKLEKYALEACRLEPQAFGLLRIADNAGTIQDHNNNVQHEAGDLIFTDFVAAGRDKARYGDNVNEIDIARDMNSYIFHGAGSHACIGRDIATTALGVQLGLFAKLKNLKRVPGQAGQLKYTMKLAGENPGSIRAYMSEDWSRWWPFPTTMKIQHEGFCKTLEEHYQPTPSSKARNGLGLIPQIRTNGDV